MFPLILFLTTFQHKLKYWTNYNKTFFNYNPILPMSPMNAMEKNTMSIKTNFKLTPLIQYNYDYKIKNKRGVYNYQKPCLQKIMNYYYYNFLSNKLNKKDIKQIDLILKSISLNIKKLEQYNEKINNKII